MSEQKSSDNKKVILIFIAILILFAFIIRYKPYEYKIQHDYPMMIGSADANSRVSEAEWYVKSKQSYYQPEWFDDSLKNIIEIEPPLSGTLAAMLSQFSGIPAADMLFFVTIFAGIGISIVTLLMFWKIFKNIWLGMIAATILIYPFEPFGNFYIGIGYYPHFLQLVFLILGLLFLYRFLENQSWTSIFGISLMFAFAFYSHVPNALLLFLFIIIISSYFVIIKKIPIIKVLAIVIISLAIVSVYIPIFYENYLSRLISYQASQNTDKFFETKLLFSNRAAWHPVQISNFINIIFYIFLLIGIILSFYFKKKEHIILTLFFFFFFILFMISNLLGFYNPHLHEKPRYIIYVFAYPVVALGIFFIIILLKNLIKIDYKIFAMITILLLLMFQTYHLVKTPSVQGSILTRETYSGYLWARDNIPKDKKILCIGCYQFEGLYTHHPTHLPAYEVDPSVIQQMNDIAQNISKNNKIVTTSMGHSDLRLYWSGFKIKQHGDKPQINRSICEFDYVIFKGFGQLTPIIRNIALRFSINNTVIYENDAMIIFKNNNVNGECI